MAAKRPPAAGLNDHLPAHHCPCRAGRRQAVARHLCHARGGGRQAGAGGADAGGAARGGDRVRTGPRATPPPPPTTRSRSRCLLRRTAPAASSHPSSPPATRSYENIVQIRCLLEGVTPDEMLERWHAMLPEAMRRWGLDRGEVRVMQGTAVLGMPSAPQAQQRNTPAELPPHRRPAAPTRTFTAAGGVVWVHARRVDGRRPGRLAGPQPHLPGRGRRHARAHGGARGVHRHHQAGAVHGGHPAPDGGHRLPPRPHLQPDGVRPGAVRRACAMAAAAGCRVRWPYWRAGLVQAGWCRMAGTAPAPRQPRRS